LSSTDLVSRCLEPFAKRRFEKLLPLAEELKIVIAIEEVWNKFLLSPLEMAKYIGEFQSPGSRRGSMWKCRALRYPQDWIRTLGKGIAKST